MPDPTTNAAVQAVLGKIRSGEPARYGETAAALNAILSGYKSERENIIPQLRGSVRWNPSVSNLNFQAMPQYWTNTLNEAQQYTPPALTNVPNTMVLSSHGSIIGGFTPDVNYKGFPIVPNLDASLPAIEAIYDSSRTNMAQYRNKKTFPTNQEINDHFNAYKELIDSWLAGNRVTLGEIASAAGPRTNDVRNLLNLACYGGGCSAQEAAKYFPNMTNYVSAGRKNPINQLHTKMLSSRGVPKEREEFRDLYESNATNFPIWRVIGDRSGPGGEFVPQSTNLVRYMQDWLPTNVVNAVLGKP